MKGISLSIETVIVMIIAAVVLAVLVLYFKGTVFQGKSQIDAEGERAKACADYMKLDKNCDGKADDSASSGLLDPARKRIVEICNQLNYPECKPNDNSGCIHKCCIGSG